MTARSPALIAVDGVSIGGDGLTFDTLEGWYSAPASRSAFVDRPNAHGSFDSPVFRSARVVTVGGWAYADTRALVTATLLAVTGILAEGELGDFTVADPDYGTLTVRGRVTDGPMIDWSPSQQAFIYQFTITAPDPRKYAATITAVAALPTAASGGLAFPLFDVTGFLEFGGTGTTGQATVANRGTADTFPLFTVTGPVLGGVDISEVATGRHITYSGDVPAGAVLVIDPSTGHAYLNGSLRDTWLTRREWWAIKAGASSTVQFATLGAAGQTGTLAVSIRPAYW